MTEETYNKAKEIRAKIQAAKSRIKIAMNNEDFLREHHKYKNDLNCQLKADHYAKQVRKHTEELDKWKKAFKEL